MKPHVEQIELFFCQTFDHVYHLSSIAVCCITEVKAAKNICSYCSSAVKINFACEFGQLGWLCLLISLTSLAPSIAVVTVSQNFCSITLASVLHRLLIFLDRFVARKCFSTYFCLPVRIQNKFVNVILWHNINNHRRTRSQNFSRFWPLLKFWDQPKFKWAV